MKAKIVLPDGASVRIEENTIAVIGKDGVVLFVYGLPATAVSADDDPSGPHTKPPPPPGHNP